MPLPTYECLRCGHKWHPRSDRRPDRCPSAIHPAGTGPGRQQWRKNEPDGGEDLKRYRERLNRILDSDIYSIERIEHNYPVVIPDGSKKYRFEIKH